MLAKSVRAILLCFAAALATVACGGRVTDAQIARAIAPYASDFGKGWSGFFPSQPSPCIRAETACAAANLSLRQRVLSTAIVGVFPTQAAAKHAFARSTGGWRVGVKEVASALLGTRLRYSARVLNREIQVIAGIKVVSVTVRYRLLSGVSKHFRSDYVPFLADLVAFRTGRVVANVEFDRVAREHRGEVIRHMLMRASVLNTR